MNLCKKLVILIYPLVLYSCSSDSKKQEVAEDTIAQPILQVDSSKILADSAMALLVEANQYVAKGIKKEMSNNKVNEIINPLMERYFILYSKLKPEDTLRVYQFRIDKLNELIDLQMEYSN